MVMYRKCTLQHRGKIIYFAFNSIAIMLYVFEKSVNNFWSYLFPYKLIGLDDILIIILPLNVKMLIHIPKINLTLNTEYIWNFKRKLLHTNCKILRFHLKESRFLACLLELRCGLPGNVWIISEKWEALLSRDRHSLCRPPWSTQLPGDRNIN